MANKRGPRNGVTGEVHQNTKSNMLLSLAAVLQTGAPPSPTPALVDSAAKEDVSFLPNTLVNNNSNTTTTELVSDKEEDAGNAIKPDLSSSLYGGVAMPGNSVQPELQVLLPMNMDIPMTVHESRTMPVPMSNAPAFDANSHRHAIPADNSCFHCPHCRMGISAADIAKATAEQHLRNAAKLAQISTQQDLVLTQPFVNIQFDAEPAPVQADGQVVNASIGSTEPHATQLVMPDVEIAPEQASRGQSKKSTALRPRHIIHVGSELKDAATRLTAMLPTTGLVAEFLQPLLDKSCRIYDSVYSARVTNEDFARAINESITRVASTAEGRAYLKQIRQAIQNHPDLQKPKRPARTTYAADKYAASGPLKSRNKRPDKNTGSTPVLGRDSEEPQLAFRREFGSRLSFITLALYVLDGEAPGDDIVEKTRCRAVASVQEKNLILWVGLFCLLDTALLQCKEKGKTAAQQEVHQYFLDWVLPRRLHYATQLLPTVTEVVGTEVVVEQGTNAAQ